MPTHSIGLTFCTLQCQLSDEITPRHFAGGRGRDFRCIAPIGRCSRFTGPSAAIPLPQGIPPVVTLVVLLRLTGVAAGLVRGGNSGKAESRGGNEDSQSESGDD